MKTIFSYTSAQIHEDEQPDVLIEKFDDGSIGIAIPMDGAELRYFNRNEIIMIANALLSVSGE